MFIQRIDIQEFSVPAAVFLGLRVGIALQRSDIRVRNSFNNIYLACQKLVKRLAAIRNYFIYQFIYIRLASLPIIFVFVNVTPPSESISLMANGPVPIGFANTLLQTFRHNYWG